MKAEMNPDPQLVVASGNKSLVLIHVGKCAGESALRAIRTLLPDHFFLAEMHCFDANKRIREVVFSGGSDVRFIILKREPVSRFISSFNWDKHNLFLKGSLKGTVWEDAFNRFPTVNSLVSGLQGPDEKTRDFAKRFARFGHMGMGQSWYTPPEVVDRLPHDRTFVFEVKTLRSDLRDFCAAMGHPVMDTKWQPQKLKSDYSSGYNNPQELFPDFLSSENRQALSNFICQDIRVYEALSEFHS